jgi:hypothetical protein
MEDKCLPFPVIFGGIIADVCEILLFHVISHNAVIWVASLSVTQRALYTVLL